MHSCVGGREEKHQPHAVLGMFWGCHWQCQPGGVPNCPPGTAAQFQAGHSGRGWHLGCEECCGGWDVLLCQWDSESPVLWDPLCTPERLWEGTPRLLTQAGLCWAPSSTATSHRSHCKTGLGLSFLTASGKINVLILRVSFFQWTFPCWAGISISCWHRADSCSLWDPSFLALSTKNLTF